jgi:signal transduction histidine kinase
MSEESQSPEQKSSEAAAQPVWIELSPGMRDALLDPEIWYESLEAYAHATNLAVALVDTERRVIGTCINPQPTWSRLHAHRVAADGECPFALMPRMPCTCIGDALATHGLVLVRDRTGLVHFTVPLMLGEQAVGVLLAGQVFDRFPELLPLEHVARHFGVSPHEVWQGARLELLVKRATLRVYGRLLAILGNAFLRTRYYTLLEAIRLDTLEQHIQERTAALHHALAERQRLEREAQRAEHFAMLGRLAAGVSHEIRNPLAAVFLHVDVLEEELHQPSPDSPATVAETLAEIRTQLGRVEELVQNYLSLVRVGNIEPTPQDLGAAVATWATEAQGQAVARGITLHLQGLTDLGLVAFHAATLRRAVVNLVQNALDAMPQGGRLTLAGQSTATQVQVQVQDTGSGIPAALLKQIFEPLYTTKPGGSGLGLYIVQEVVTAHGGQLTVQSTEGHGTTFTITLPRTTGEAGTEAL